MSQFLSHNITPPSPAVALDWHPAEPLLAVSCDDGSIHNYTEEGERLDPPLAREGQQPTAVAWSPTQRVLVAGWQDGWVLAWIDGEVTDVVAAEGQSMHKAAITCVEWHPTGKRVVTCDSDGVIGVWRVDKHGRLSPACQYTKESPVTGCKFRTASVGAPKPQFFVSFEDGSVHLCDDSGSLCVECCNAESPVAAMFYYEERDTLVLVTEGSMLFHLRFSPTTPNRLELFSQLKLIMPGASNVVGDPGELDPEWCAIGIVALTTRESIIRCWDVNRAQNFVITALDPSSGVAAKDAAVNSITFNNVRKAVAAGTEGGKVLMWQYVGPESTIPRDEAGPEGSAEDGMAELEQETMASNWEQLEPLALGSSVGLVSWGPGERLLAAITQGGAAVQVISETVMLSSMSIGTAAFQTSSTEIAVERHLIPKTVVMNSEVPIKYLKTFGNRILVWNGQQCGIYTVGEDMNITKESIVSTRSTAVAFHPDRGLLLVNEGKIQLCNMSGVSKQTIAFAPAEGEPVLLDICGDFLAVVTSNNLLKVFDLQKREVRPHGLQKSFENVKGVGQITSVSINKDGSRVSFLCTEVGGTKPAGMVFVYIVENGKLYSYNFERVGHYPISHYWDPGFTKMIVCETKSTRRAKKVEEEEIGSSPYCNHVAVLFAPNDGDLDPKAEPTLLHQETIPLPDDADSLLSVKCPHLFYAAKIHGHGAPQGGGSKQPALLLSVPMRNFTGMEEVDNTTKEAVLQFSYYLALGNTDEAYKAIKAVQNPNVWTNMAHMMIKAKRADMLPALAICLGNMGNARASMALRISSKEPEPEARLAAVAIHLGLTDEAERLLRTCKRYDLLVKMYQNLGRWDEAIALASESDRVHLKAVHHACGKYYESFGDVQRAKQEYKLADTHRVEVPRMLVEEDQQAELEKFVQENKSDSKILQWRGRYAESVSDFDGAMKYYQEAKDYFSVTRIHCFKGNLEEARKVVEDTGDKPSAYHLARQYEDEGSEESAREALKFYGRSGSLSHALRTAMDKEMDAEVVNLALQASPHLMLTAAHFLETRSLMEKAVLLYHKGGNVGKAISLCFQSQLYGPLAQIVDTLDNKTDPDLIIKCADYFMENEQHAKAVNLYITAGQTAKALDICTAYNVTVTEDMAERMTPPETEDPTRRVRILKAIAKVCDKQGSFTIATQKYTQAKDTVKAMKVLLKSGDTEKIIFFAAVSQQPDIYVMAANYLQTLEWRTSPELMKHIIGFYKKARAMDSLSRFYQSCAQVEIDEYRNYEKALGALKEASLYASKSKSADKAAITKALETKMRLVEQYLQARKLFKANQEEEAVSVCQQLIDACSTAKTPDDAAVRVGDVYALLVEHFYATGNMQNSYAVIEQMRSSNIDVFFHVQEEVVRAVYNAVGAVFEGPAKTEGEYVEEEQAPGRQVDEEGVQEELEAAGAADDQVAAGGGSDIEEEIETEQ